MSTFTESAWERLRGTTSLVGALLTPTARHDLDWILRWWLTAASAKVLVHEFALFRLDRRSSLDALASPGSETGSELYRAFVAHLLAGDWEAVGLEYPEWDRLRGLVIDQWVDGTAELLERLARDRDVLQRRFAGGCRIGKLLAVRPLSDDRHREGRTVLELGFVHGARVVYKPRPVGIEVWFGQLLSWLSGERPSLLDPGTCSIVDRGTYGWSEFIPVRSCRSIDAVSRFFQRSGALLAVLHALGSVDCHLENLIAHGEHPVLVDAETVLQPRPRLWRRPSVDSCPQDRTEVAGVLETGFLPRPSRRDDADTSGLDGGRITRPIEGALVWRGINTDRMALVDGTASSMNTANGAYLGSQRVDPCRHEAELLLGFDSMYARLVEMRPSLLESSLWKSARGCAIRFLARSTSTYWLMALESLEPRFLRNGSTRRGELERLFVVRDACADAARILPLLQAEVDALARLDVPAFYVPSDDRDLQLQADTIPGFFQESGLGRSARRIGRLGPEDQARQHDLIRQSLATVATSSP